ncbi:hypothetical protein CkaCkLH20_11604 [Colletotrichum karsti]|uniref:beta-glucosidase n=1 Tax=Colletotrichum karsti TaxID=1095194 RepID=A0A9P6LG09_9PEZI|nr:uncharacterized protein CkaCkLH20_11604 [Colletotrichum karsti]KAF9870932.1 hypothetical protein CkaCkLH20_11604 [Colletotrichum karsti]
MMGANAAVFDILTGEPLNNSLDEWGQEQRFQAHLNVKTPSPWSAYCYIISVYLVGLMFFSIALNCKEKHRATFIVGFCAIGVEIIRSCSGLDINYTLKDTIIKTITIQCSGSVVMVLREKFVLTEKQKQLPWGRRAIATYKALWNGRFVGTTRPAPIFHLLEEQGQQNAPPVVIETSTEKSKTKPEKSRERSESTAASNKPMPTADLLGAPMDRGIMLRAWNLACRYAFKIWYSARLRFILKSVAHLVIIVMIEDLKDVMATRYLAYSWRDVADHKRSIVRRYLRGDPVDLREVVIRAFFAFQGVWGAYNWYNRIHLLAGLFFVGIGVDEPEEWPPVFGDIRQAWSVRRYWSKYFDRITYRPVNGLGEIFMEYGGFGQRPYRGKKRWVLNGLVFAISGFFHAFSDYFAGVECGFWSEVGWWVGNYFAIVGETVFLWTLHTYCPRFYNAMSGMVAQFAIMSKALVDVAQAIKDLTLEEKIRLLAGKDTWTTHSIDRLNIPSITTSDGPHGVRGTAFFNGPPGCLLPSATAMGATFDVELMHSVGKMLATEAKEKKCQVILAPTVCLQRSPLIGRGFEAFGEDPVLSGTLASAYINGVQENGVAICIKHFAAHDQSTMSIEDSIRVTERTLRELHFMPFQIAVRKANPWSFMTAYHRINGIHASENPWLLDDILRQEWKWDGLVMSDWFGTYSTSEAVNAGLDLEMPGPARWRGQLLTWALLCRKVKESTIDDRVRNLLNLINKVHPALEYLPDENHGDTEEKRQICRKVASDSIVLLKNEREVLPLDASSNKTLGLIGPAVRLPAVSGGGSADLTPYYVSTPLDAITEVVGNALVKTAVGCYGHLFTPLLSSDVSIPGTHQPGYILNWFRENFEEHPGAKPLHTTTTTQAQMYFADSLPETVPGEYWLRVMTVYTAPKTMTIQVGLCVIGKGKLYVNGKQVIDVFTSQPKKTLQTPMFNQASMEVVADVEVEAGKQYLLSVLLRNEAAIPGVGALSAGGLRIGCCEKIDPAKALNDAVQLAKDVDIPIVIAGLNADYESEAVDRKSLQLPPGVDGLIQRVVEANPNTVVVTQSGCPIAMPWIQKAATVLHAWFGGQETGNAIADVLFGKVNPNGRLPVTFPARLEDTPAFLTFGKGQRDIMYGEGVFIGHRYYEKVKTRPLFYFGYGLSYTNFEYSNLCMPKTVRLDDASAKTFGVFVDVRNSGSRDGYEVVQVYVHDVEVAFDRPRKELKGFAKVWIEAGDVKTVRLTLDKYALSYWNEELEHWLAERGAFRVIISRSADPEDEILTADFELEENVSWKGI